jgi:hypothetical protein
LGLLTGILASPAKGLGFIFAQIRDNVDRELYDETIWQQKLLDVQLRYDMGEISEEDYFGQEEIIVAQLELISLMRFAGYDEEEEAEILPDENEIEPKEKVLNAPNYVITN